MWKREIVVILILLTAPLLSAQEEEISPFTGTTFYSQQKATTDTRGVQDDQTIMVSVFPLTDLAQILGKNGTSLIIGDNQLPVEAELRNNELRLNETNCVYRYKNRIYQFGLKISGPWESESPDKKVLQNLAKFIKIHLTAFASMPVLAIDFDRNGGYTFSAYSSRKSSEALYRQAYNNKHKKQTGV